MTVEDVLNHLIDECHQDHVGLWEVVNAVHFDLGKKDAAETQALTLELVRSLLDKHGIQVGLPAPDGRDFVAWDLPAAEAVHRIEKEWSRLGREPSIGEVAWFTSASSPAAP
jgi:hypothetical protein